MNKLQKYLVFLLGLFISSFGVSIVTKANLGTSPISSIPFVLSKQFPLTLGEFTIIFSLILIFLQILILRKNFKLEHILQIPVSIIFGYFIDFSMIILNNLNPTEYKMKLIFLLLGCIVLGFGIYFEIVANVVMLPGESFVRAIVITFNKDFGNTKIAFDASMTIIACIISLISFHYLNGIREGTIIAAFLVGFIAKLLSLLFSKIKVITK